MAHKRITTETLRIKVNCILDHHLDLAVGSGLFGATRQQCAERLIAEGLRRLIKEGVITAEPVSLTPSNENET